ncbi:hypothetical protein PV325_013670 [Microctonus aethiopoides]|uniref:Uncharacterized protein n=1 Tax=Microctonus aethiopoides TaxID=144406 RepID=A0AA39FHM6_9HYME|nr:hypothetical protein PV325_013670 [Microctonus aethiopoides]KAK0169611.1 hypothetical protein PV328_011825 [Microctonus aethiopoides]
MVAEIGTPLEPGAPLAEVNPVNWQQMVETLRKTVERQAAVIDRLLQQPQQPQQQQQPEEEEKYNPQQQQQQPRRLGPHRQGRRRGAGASRACFYAKRARRAYNLKENKPGVHVHYNP